MGDYSRFIPISREELERGLEQAIRDGLSRPGDTYEDYLIQVTLACYGLDRDGNKLW